MKKINFGIYFWIRMALRTMVLFWFYQLGRIASLSERIHQSSATLHGNKHGIFLWIETTGTTGHNFGMFLWQGVFVAFLVYILIEFSFVLRGDSGNEE